MDQEVLSGVGNIYRAEVLFRHRVNPFTPGEAMEPQRPCKAIWKDLGPLLRAGMVDRRIVCTRRADRPSKKEPASKGEEHYVYRRHGKPCFICGEPILRRDVAGRTLYWCPKDQATTDAENGRAYTPGMSLRAARAAEKRGRAGVADRLGLRHGRKYLNAEEWKKARLRRERWHQHSRRTTTAFSA